MRSCKTTYDDHNSNKLMSALRSMVIKDEETRCRTFEEENISGI